MNSGVLNIRRKVVDINELVEKAKTGEAESLTVLYNMYFEPIFKFIFFRVGHKESAEDLTEEVFIKAFSKVKTIKNNEHWNAWLYQIAKNKIIDHYRKSVVNTPIEEVENILEYHDNISELLDNSTDKQLILSSLTQLSKEHRLVLEMKFFEGLDNETISNLLGKNEGAIRVIQHRALSKLKEIIHGK